MTISDTTEREAALRREDRAHVFRAARAHDVAGTLMIERAEGPYMWDYQGRRYLDFLSQWVFANVGHQHPRMVEALQAQTRSLCNIAPTFGNEVRAEAARSIAERAPAGLERVFLTTGGAEATEHAIRMARLHTGRHKILATYRSYHGATSSAIALSGDPRRWRGDTATSGIVHFMGPYPYRSPFGASDEREEGERAIAHLEQVIALEGPDTIAAVFLETIGGSAGVLMPPPGYLPAVRELCRRHGILLILDEVVVAWARVGKWFGFEHWGVVPDLITVGKGLTSGYSPLGGVILSDEVAGGFDERPYPAAPSFSGHLMSCAAAVENIRIIEDEGLLEHAAALGESTIGPGLRALAERHPAIGEVRGLGAFWTAELVRDHEQRRPLLASEPGPGGADPMVELATACRERGLVVGSNFSRVTVAPPCNTDAAVVEEGLAILDEALEVADRYVGS